MSSLFEIQGWILALVLWALMIPAWEVGARFGQFQRRASQVGSDAGKRVDDVSLALLGLMLAFSFSAAQGKHELRKDVVVEEAAAIRDFAGVVSLLGDPLRAELQSTIR